MPKQKLQFAPFLLALAAILFFIALSPRTTLASSTTPPPFLRQIATSTSPNTLAYFSFPGYFAFSTTSQMYVANQGGSPSEISKYDTNGSLIAGNWTTGYSPAFSPGYVGIALDPSGNVYVIDDNNNQVVKFNPSGAYVTAFGSALFDEPEDVATDSSGNVYVTDAGANVIDKFDSNGNLLGTVGASGTAAGDMRIPKGIFIDPSNNIYVADVLNRRVDVFNGSGTFVKAFGWGVLDGASSLELCTSSCRSGLSGSGTGQVNFPEGITVDTSGNVYLADTGNFHIEEYNSSGAFVATIGSSGSGNGQFSTNNFSLTDVAVKPSSGNLYATDGYNNRIEYFSGTTYLAEFIASGSGNGEFNSENGTVGLGVAQDALDDVYVIDPGNTRIQKFDDNGNYLTQWAYTRGTGNGQFGSDGPGGIAVDSSNHLWITDPSNNRVEEFSSTGSYLSQFGSAGTGNGSFNTPGAIAIDSSGNFYISDTGNFRVEEFNSSGTYVNKFGSSGSANGDFGFGPGAIAVDSSFNVFVGDGGNARVEKFDSTGSYVSQFGSSGTGNGQFAFGEVGDMDIDPSNNLYVVSHDRVEKFDDNGNYLTQWGSDGVADGEFNSPSGISFSHFGGHYVYVADSANDRVSTFYNDTNPPIVAITFPSGGATLSGTVTVTASSTDDIDPTPAVSLYIDGTFFGTATTTSPYSFYWNTASSTLGSHTLLAVAKDMVNYATSSAVIITIGTAPSPPSLSSPSLSDVTATSASFSYSITNAGNATSTVVGFNYGTTASYGSATSSTGSLGVGDSFSVNVSGLTCNTIYHVQGFAMNTGGTGTSTDSVFTTGRCPALTGVPSIGSVSALTLSSTTVAFTGVITSTGGALATSTGFDFGTTTSYGSSVSRTGSFDVGVFNKNTSGLSCDTTYHYKAFATNALGETDSPDGTFTTSACSSYSGTGRDDYFGYSDVLLVVNDDSATSTAIGNYFAASRGIDPNYIVHLDIPEDATTDDEASLSSGNYTNLIKTPIENFITSHGLTNVINYIVTTKGMPIFAPDGHSLESDLSSCLGYVTCPELATFDGNPFNGAAGNPYATSFGLFSHAAYGMYEVTRLDGYTIPQVEAMIDHSSNATTTSSGQYVFNASPGWNGYLGIAYTIENEDIVAGAQFVQSKGFNVNLVNTDTYLTHQTGLSGYASWGSDSWIQYNGSTALGFDGSPNGPAYSNNTYLNGAIANLNVSTSGRTFTYPPVYGQSLVADLISDGVSGVEGYVAEPQSFGIANDLALFDHYTIGYNLADSFYSANSYLSWMGVIIGDPKTDIMHTYMPSTPIAPANNSSVRNTKGLTFFWNRGELYTKAAVTYSFYLNGAAYATGITFPDYSLPSNLATGAYTWSVAAYTGGTMFASTTPYSFTVAASPTAFDLTSPSSYSSSTSTTPTFSWSASTSGNGIRKYQLYVDGNLYADNISGTSATGAPLSYGSHSWFVRVVDNTGISLNSSSTFTLNITNPDSSALSVTNFAVSNIATSSASFSWTTNRPATTMLNFGPSSSYGSSTPETDMSILVTGHNTSVAGLLPCTQYHYEAYSIDGSSVVGMSSDQSFITDGCTGDASVVGSTEQNVSTGSGGTVSFTDTYDNTLGISAPAAFTNATSSVVFQVKQIDPVAFFANTNAPTDQQPVGNSVYNISILSNTSDDVSSVNNPVSITMSYAPSDVGSLNESTLQIYRYDAPTWTALSNCSVDTNADTVTCTTSGFSDFIIAGNSTPTPGSTTPPATPTPAAPVVSSGGGGGGGGAPVGLITGSHVSPTTTTTTASSPSLTGTFTVGEQNSSVLALQKALADAGYLQAKYETGYFGALTQAALSAFLAGGAPTTTAAASTAILSVKTDLYLGITSSNVKILQQFLNAQGYTITKTGTGSLGDESTYFGALTKAALIKFQAAQGVSDTGYFGPLTRAKIAALK